MSWTTFSYLVINYISVCGGQPIYIYIYADSIINDKNMKVAAQFCITD